MKKLLSVMLVLVMVASIVAIPAMATPSSDYTPLPYTTESFESYRNGLSTTADANFRLNEQMEIAVLTGRFPLYGDSALIGVHKTVNGASFSNDAKDTYKNTSKQDVVIVADTTSSSIGNTGNKNYANKVLKVSAATQNDVRGVSFGFVPNDVLSQVEGLYFKWDERAVKAADSAKAILQWVNANGLAVGENVAEVEHNKDLNADTATTVTVTVSDNEIVYENGDAQSIELDLSQPPESAVGIKLVVEYTTGSDGLETYLDNFEVGTYSNDRAAFVGDSNNVDYEATIVNVKFAAAVTNYANVKLYKDNTEVSGATYSLSDDNKTLTVTAPAQLGTSGGYRISTSKATTASGSIVNDVTFKTQLKATSAAVVQPNVFEIYDLNGNKLDSSVDITSTTNDEDETIYSMNIQIFVEDSVDIPKAVVPSFKYTGSDSSKFHPDFFYGYNPNWKALDSQFLWELRGLYPVVNGATAIPVKNFILLQGVGSGANNHRYYNVTMDAKVIPESVTAEIAAKEGEQLDNVGLLSPVTVTFSHDIADTSSFKIEENGTEYSDYTATWSDGNKKVVITPNTMWTLGESYTVSIDADASIFGDKVEIAASDLSFTATTTVPPAAGLETFEFTDDDIIYTFDAETKTIVLVKKTEDTSVDFSALAYTATVDAVGAFVEGATVSEDEYTGTVDASSANGLANAVELVVDNGFDVDTTYKIYYITTTEPATQTVQYKLTETFENATVGERFTGDRAVASAGYSGSIGGVPTTNNSNGSGIVMQEGENKFLRLTASGVNTNQYSNFITAAIPQEFYKNADKLIIRFDVRQQNEYVEGRIGFGGAANETAGVDAKGGNSDKYAATLWTVSRNFTPMRNSNANSSYATDSGLDPIPYNQTQPSLYYGTAWKTVQFEIYNQTIGSTGGKRDTAYVGKIGTGLGIKVKAQGAEDWEEESALGENSTFAWNFKNEKFVRFHMSGLKTNSNDNTKADVIGDFDNVSIYAITKDLSTSVAIESGDDLEVGDSVKVTFKTPIKPGLEDKFVFKDNDGNEVDYTYSWSEDRLTITLTPDVDANKIYKLSAEDLKDVYDNDISVSADIPVLPDEDYADYSETANYTVIPGDHSQKLNILYKFDETSTQKINVQFKYGSNSYEVSDVKVTKPAAGVNYATVVVDVPSEIIASGTETVKLVVTPQNFDIKVLGVYFEDGLVLSDVNGASNRSDAITALEKIAKWVGNFDEFDKLVESVVNDFADELLDKLEDGDFATLEAVKTWYNTEFATAKENNPDPDVKPDKGDGSNGGNDGSGGSYAGGSSYTPTPSEIAPTLKQFKDLGSVAWAKTAINTLYAAGIISGVSEDEFAPLNDITREEFVKLIVELFGIHDPFLKSTFKDVDPDAWYNSYIAAAEQAGLISGVSATDFGVGQKITREQMATILKRACDKFGVTLSGGATTTFIDQNTISDYATDAVKALAKAGIFSGIDGSFAPQQVANRAMAAQVIYLIYILL